MIRVIKHGNFVPPAEMPIEERITTCDYCTCEFSYTINEIIVVNVHYDIDWVRCPECRFKTIVKRIT